MKHILFLTLITSLFSLSLSAGKYPLPLHCASMDGNLKIVKLLILNGANVNAKDLEGYTPFQWAKKEKHEKVIQFFKNNAKKTTTTQTKKQQN